MNGKRSIIVLLLIIFITGITFAQLSERRKGQGGNGNRYGMHAMVFNLSDLTEDQITQIKALRIEHMKSMLDNHNKIKEKRAQLKTLETSDNADLKAINKMIDEISVLRVNIEKAKAAHRQQIRNLLTEEQRVIFDSHPHGPGQGRMFERNHRYQRGKGRCW